MKTNRIITLLMVLVTTITTFAQKQLTIINEDTGDSFEVTVPEGLKIYQYNENWLDSIPYLMEHVRNKESWAYENLARCYRYGIGVEKCLTNAMIFYDESDLRAMDIAEEAYANDPTDELGFMNHLMEGLSKEKITIDEGLVMIDEYPDPKPSWMVKMKTIFANRDAEDLEAYIKSTIDWDAITGDEILVSVACLMILRPDTPSVTSRPPKPEFMQHLTMVAEKIPVLYMKAGDRYWELYEDCPTDEQAMRSAFELYHNAYLYGLLDMGGAIAVLDYRDANSLYDGFPFTQEELAHLDSRYSKELRERWHEPCVEEELIVVEEGEWDENPIELIEEE